MLATCGAVTACGGGEPVESESEVAFGVLRDVPLENPCQWLTVDEAAEAMQRAGVDLGSSAVGTVTNVLALGDDGADCWYQPRAGATGRLSITLLASPEAASNWRERMEDVAAQGGREEGGDITRVFTRVADAPTLQQSRQTADEASCDVFALTGDAAVVSVALGVDGASDDESLCSEAEGVLGVVIGRLPEAG